MIGYVSVRCIDSSKDVKMIPLPCFTLEHCGELVKCRMRVVVLPSIADYFLIPLIT